jgi:2-oxoglutarate ferredoxin oxidoreductase subunit beta
MIERMAAHRGAAFLEVYQNCNIFNDGAFDGFKDRSVKDHRTVELEDGKPITFAKGAKGVRLDGLRPEVVDLGGESPWTEADLLVHREDLADSTHATLLSRMQYPDMPVAIGVLRQVTRPSYDTMLAEQIETARARSGPGDLRKLIYGGDMWEVEG